MELFDLTKSVLKFEMISKLSRITEPRIKERTARRNSANLSKTKAHFCKRGRQVWLHQSWTVKTGLVHNSWEIIFNADHVVLTCGQYDVAVYVSKYADMLCCKWSLVYVALYVTRYLGMLCCKCDNVGMLCCKWGFVYVALYVTKYVGMLCCKCDNVGMLCRKCDNVGMLCCKCGWDAAAVNVTKYV